MISEKVFELVKECATGCAELQKELDRMDNGYMDVEAFDKRLKVVADMTGNVRERVSTWTLAEAHTAVRLVAYINAVAMLRLQHDKDTYDEVIDYIKSSKKNNQDAAITRRRLPPVTDDELSLVASLLTGYL